MRYCAEPCNRADLGHSLGHQREGALQCIHQYNLYSYQLDRAKWIHDYCRTADMMRCPITRTRATTQQCFFLPTNPGDKWHLIYPGDSPPRPSLNTGLHYKSGPGASVRGVIQGRKSKEAAKHCNTIRHSFTDSTGHQQYLIRVYPARHRFSGLQNVVPSKNECVNYSYHI